MQMLTRKHRIRNIGNKNRAKRRRQESVCYYYYAASPAMQTLLDAGY